jgi:hypothetical protein
MNSTQKLAFMEDDKYTLLFLREKLKFMFPRLNGHVSRKITIVTFLPSME